MKIAIIGSHPPLAANFVPVVSVYLAKWLKRFNPTREVTIYCDYRVTFEGIFRKYGNYGVVLGSKIETNPDIIICVDHPGYYIATYPIDEIRQANPDSVIIILVPQLGHYIIGNDRETWVDFFKKFDGIGTALYWDYLWVERNFEAFLGYCPRGADPVILLPELKTMVPSIAIDMGWSDEHASVEELLGAIDILRKKWMDLRVYTMYPYPQTTDWGRQGTFEEIYKNFFSPAWIYCSSYPSMDVNSKDPDPRDGQKHRHMPTYNLPVVEAQMAGCSVFAVRGSIQEELFMEG